MKSCSIASLVILVLIVIFPTINKVGNFNEAGTNLSNQVLELDRRQEGGSQQRQIEIAERVHLLGDQADFVISHLHKKLLAVGALSIVVFACLYRRSSSQ